MRVLPQKLLNIRRFQENFVDTYILLTEGTGLPRSPFKTTAICDFAGAVLGILASLGLVPNRPVFNNLSLPVLNQRHKHLSLKDKPCGIRHNTRIFHHPHLHCITETVASSPAGHH